MYWWSSKLSRMCFLWQVVAFTIIHSSRGLNACLDPSTDSFVCRPATDRIDLEGCEVAPDDADDLATCLAVAREAGVTTLSLGHATEDIMLNDSSADVIFDDHFFARLGMQTIAEESSRAFPDVDVAKEVRRVLIEEAEPCVSTFPELATERFEARVAVSAIEEREGGAFSHLQLIRVPKAGSSEASVIARILAGCTPRGPCCVPFDGPSCHADLQACPQVIGCNGHKMGVKENRALESPSMFSLSHMRDTVDRFVSGFFYGSGGHSPPCAQEQNVDYEEWFAEMSSMPKYQNVASRMFAGHFAYETDARICMADDAEDCAESLKSVLAGACNANVILITELWQTSVLLLFETLPWLRPTLDYFPVVQANPDVDHGEYVVARQNNDARHEEGMKHITPDMREAARQANPVDDALHEFVSAKFCHRLHATGLLNHTLVADELGKYALLHERCMDDIWIATTLKHFQPLVPVDCRLYRPIARHELYIRRSAPRSEPTIFDGGKLPTA